MSQICDKGNELRFISASCTMTNIESGKVILIAKRWKNIDVAELSSIKDHDITCLSALEDDVELWHRRLGHVSPLLLNKLVSKDLVCRLPKLKFIDHKFCDACVKGNQVRSSFKPKKDVRTSKSLELLHMDLVGL